MEEVVNLEHRESPMRRATSFSTVVFIGHLFDTKFFNEAISALSNQGINYRVIEWEVGTTDHEKSMVSLQILAKDPTKLHKAMEDIEVLTK